MADPLDDQYADARNLTARANLHRQTGRGGWWPFLKGLVDWSPGAAILDAGCGPGWFWADPGPDPALEITLLDRSPGMVAEALTAVGRARPGDLATGVVADAAALPLPDASQDGVLALHMLYHLRDPDRAIAEFARVLRPGGWCLVTTSALENMIELGRLTEAVFGTPPTDLAARSFGLHDGPDRLARAFADVSVHPVGSTATMTNPQTALDYFTSMPPANRATPAERTALEAAVARAFAAGPFQITKRSGAIVCRTA